MKTKTINLFTFDELSATAKEVARDWYLDDELRVNQIADTWKEGLAYLFPNSSLNVQFSLSSCQGDGVNIYGTLDSADFNGLMDRNPELFKDFKEIHISEDECKKFHFDLKENRRYSYCMASQMKTILDDDFDENISEESFELYRQYAVRIFQHICREYENEGYDYLFHASDEEISEAGKCNGWLFYENGQFCPDAYRYYEEQEDLSECFPGLYHIVHVPTEAEFLVKADSVQNALPIAIKANKGIGPLEDSSLDNTAEYTVELVDFAVLTTMFRNCSSKSNFWGADADSISFVID